MTDRQTDTHCNDTNKVLFHIYTESKKIVISFIYKPKPYIRQNNILYIYIYISRKRREGGSFILMLLILGLPRSPSPGPTGALIYHSIYVMQNIILICVFLAGFICRTLDGIVLLLLLNYNSK